MKRVTELKMVEGEYWWGGAVSDGIYMPFGTETFARELNPNLTPNQAAPILISSKGRFAWSEDRLRFEFKDDSLFLEGGAADIEIEDGYESLRGAYRAIQAKKFPAKGQIPDESMFTHPQYNTWIELMYDQDQHRIIKYAESIVSNGMPPGLLMIDDNWQEDYGAWDFHPGRFENPRRMVERLHELGFKVMLWTCPFVSPDSAVFRELSRLGYLIKNEDGTVAIREWWNGFSALLDLTNLAANEWFEAQLNRLKDQYGIDGFKFDGGDPMYYRDSDQCAARTTSNGHCEAYARIGLKYPLNEYRACWKLAGEPLAQRLCDKAHSWGEDGLASLIPNGLSQGLMGYAFTCPDMIGGGEYMNFLANSDHLDEELFVRYAQCSALFPMMQFSAAPWRVLNKEHFGYCVEAAKLHAEFGTLIVELANHAAMTGEPIMRHMAYEFAGGNFEEVNDQFMLGSEVLVAPVITKGAEERTIRFPVGIWCGDDGSVVQGPCETMVKAPLSRLPWYRKEA
ncbi:glycoside hydrolase family 31 protein [Paenibacillus sp. LHD-38]|uniref:glycoside hydrolase family 31 protein n=1 Tax=Paenibacillus sp. LHD-38 TaxID=3072143 RepID=UPI00280FCF35|nr:glycoside hydrolase family 31 protein [Paenibacillus sp. LHD-38]MDQ8736432.1 glycoside hydrolase family 31 protein [Paenibacillus sp. LHD-38]